MFFRKLGIMGSMMFSMAAQGAESNPLLGCWSCVDGDSRTALSFDASRYVMDGESSAYRLVAGAIQVPEPDGYSRYPFSIDNNGRLTIHVEDSPPLICSRSACPAGAAAR